MNFKSKISHFDTSSFGQGSLSFFIHLTKQCKEGCYFCMWAARCFDLSISSLMDKEPRSDTSPLSALLSNEPALFVQKEHKREWERGQKMEERSDLNTERERKRFWCHTNAMSIYEAKEKDIDKDSAAECLKLFPSGSSRRGMISNWMK